MGNPGWIDVYAVQVGIGLGFAAFAVGALRLVWSGVQRL
jgi:hypothetical protein